MKTYFSIKAALNAQYTATCPAQADSRLDRSCNLCCACGRYDKLLNPCTRCELKQANEICWHTKR